MPKNKFQDVVFTIIMASVMVYGMVAYNIVLNTGSLENWVFSAVFHEWPIMVLIAIALELVFVGRLAMKVAFRLCFSRKKKNKRSGRPVSDHACDLCCIRLDHVPLHELFCDPAVQGQPQCAVPRHLDTDYRHEFPDGAPAPVFLCRPDYAPHLRRAVPREKRRSGSADRARLNQSKRHPFGCLSVWR